MSFRCRYLWMGFLALVLLAGAGTTVNLVRDNLRDRRIDRKITALLPMVQIGDQDSFHQQVDKIRDFIWSNSIHRIDDDFRKIQEHPDRQIDLLRAFAAGETIEKPHLECSTRSGLVERLLRGLGYKTRSVSTWRPDERLSSHTFLEVWNDRENHWEITDPDHDLYWFDREQKRRAGIEDLLHRPITEFQLCNTAEGCPAPSLMRDQKRIAKMAALFGVAVIRDHAAGTRTLYHNPSRFDLDRTYFCERFGKYCRDRRVIIPGY